MKVIIVCVLCLKGRVLLFILCFLLICYSFTFSVIFYYTFSFHFISLGISRHLLLYSFSPLSNWRHLHIFFIPSSGPKMARHRTEGKERKLKLKCHLSPKPFLNIFNWSRFLILFLYSKLARLTIVIIRNVSPRSESRDLKHLIFSKLEGNAVELSVQARTCTSYYFLWFLLSPYFDPLLLSPFTSVHSSPSFSFTFIPLISFRHPLKQLPSPPSPPLPLFSPCSPSQWWY